MERAKSAISYIPATDRETWIKVGMAIKSEFGEDGFDIWNEWSKSAESSYSPSAAKAVWKSIRSKSISIGSVFYLAKQYGWIDDGKTKKLSPEELRLRKEKAERRMKEEEAKIFRNNQRAANKALKLWRAARPVAPDHPYLVRKQVVPVETLREISIAEAISILGYHPKSDDIPLAGRLIVVPIKVGSSLSSCEMIDEQGRKTAIYGSAKMAGFWAAQALPAEDTPDALIAVGEGVATMLSAKLATGCYAVGALTHHNIAAVVQQLKSRYSKAKLVILGDLSKKTGGPDACALKAAATNNVAAVFPQFDEFHAGLTDFNDMHVVYGLQVVNRVIAEHA